MKTFKERIDSNLKIIEESINNMDYESHEMLKNDIVKTIKDLNGKIVISGLGKNVPIAEKFVGTLNSLSVPSNFMHTNTAIHGDLGMIRDNDIVILLSKSGNTKETVELAHHLNRRNCKVWLITFNKDNRLSKMINNQLVFNIAYEGDKWDKVPHNSTSVYLIYLQELALYIADLLGNTERIDSFLVNHPGGAIGECAGIE